MYRLFIENKAGDEIELSRNPGYDVVSVTGITPSGATISTSTVAALDGESNNSSEERYNSSKKNKRNIVITLRPRMPVDKNRIKLYRYLQSGKEVRVTFQNDLRNVYISGYVESMECDLFEQKEMVAASIVCPDSSFRSNADHTASSADQIISCFKFPFYFPEEGISFGEIVERGDCLTVEYGGDVDAGIRAEIEFMTNISGFYMQADDGRKLGLNFSFKRFDRLTVSTVTNKKGVTLLRDGKETSLLGHICESAADWITLRSGENRIIISSDTGQCGMAYRLSWEELYEGV